MANKTIGSIMIREIIRMKQKGFSNCRISQSLGKSRTTVLKYLSVIKDLALNFKELLELSDKDLSELLVPPNDFRPDDRQTIHAELFAFFPYMEKELKRVGVTRGILWEEYKNKHPQGVMYSRFCDQYNQYNTKHKYKIVYYFILSPALSEGEGVKIGLFYISVWYNKKSQGYICLQHTKRGENCL
jgi:hypothetical protein